MKMNRRTVNSQRVLLVRSRPLEKKRTVLHGRPAHRQSLGQRLEWLYIHLPFLSVKTRRETLKQKQMNNKSQEFPENTEVEKNSEPEESAYPGDDYWQVEESPIPIDPSKSENDGQDRRNDAGNAD